MQGTSYFFVLTLLKWPPGISIPLPSFLKTSYYAAGRVIRDFGHMIEVNGITWHRISGCNHAASPEKFRCLIIVKGGSETKAIFL